MPQVDYNFKKTFDVAYQIDYCRKNKDKLTPQSAVNFLKSLDTDFNDTILVIGAAFGFVVEEWIKQGYKNVFALDTSAWIQQEKKNNATVEIYNIDITSTIGKQEAKALIDGAKFNWAISENVLTILSDKECVILTNSMRTLSKNVVHLVQCKSEKQEKRFPHNWKSKEEWELFLPNTTIVDLNDLIMPYFGGTMKVKIESILHDNDQIVVEYIDPYGHENARIALGIPAPITAEKLKTSLANHGPAIMDRFVKKHERVTNPIEFNIEEVNALIGTTIEVELPEPPEPKEKKTPIKNEIY